MSGTCYHEPETAFVTRATPQDVYHAAYREAMEIVVISPSREVLHLKIREAWPQQDGTVYFHCHIESRSGALMKFEGIVCSHPRHSPGCFIQLRKIGAEHLELISDQLPLVG